MTIQWEKVFGNYLTALEAAQECDWSFGVLVCNAHALHPELKFEVVSEAAWALLAQAETERNEA